MTEPDKTQSRRFFLELCFDGTDYGGWQIQPNVETVQGVLQKKLRGLFANQEIKVQGSSRTDAGVHALGMGVTFSSPPSPYIEESQIFRALNSLLPPSIKVKSLKTVPDDFHARYSACAKAYTYVVNTGQETPFSNRWSWNLTHFTKLDEVRKAADYLTGEHDFSSFAVKRSKIENAVRTIYQIDIDQLGDMVCLSFRGNGFLYKMVRSLMGTLAAVGIGKMDAESVKEILEARNRPEACDTCPPQGLFLMKVFYQEDEWRSFKLDRLPFHY
jgi:tRNA pseudouridine38-40 synthase